MANKFKAGMLNFIEVLNQMWDAFVVGPYNALPLIGGTLSGPVIAPSVIGTSAGGLANPRAILGYPGESEPSLNLARWSSQGSSDFVWSWVNGFGNLQLAYSEVGAFGSAEQKAAREVALSFVKTSTAGVYDLTSSCTYRGRFVVPRVDNAYDVGLPELAWRTIYARTGTINTSDGRLKTPLRSLTADEVAAALEIAQAVGIYHWLDAIECKGADAREHVGPTVQRAVEIMQGHGLDPFNYGFICYDAWEREVVEYPSIDGVPARTEVTREAGDRYAFRYDELAMFIAAGQAAHQDALEQRIAALEAV